MDSSDDIYKDLLKKLVDQSDETIRNIASLDKKVDLHIQKTEYELQGIKEQDIVQNKMLDEHIAGVKTLKAMHELQKEQSDTRLQKLEEPRKWFEYTKKILIWVGAVGGAIMTIKKLLG